MLVGTLSMVLLIAESWFASWCVPEDTQYVPALSQDYCKTIYKFSNASLSLTPKRSPGRRLSATMRKPCPAGQTHFMDINAIHQVDFLFFGWHLPILSTVYACLALAILGPGACQMGKKKCLPLEKVLQMVLRAK